MTAANTALNSTGDSAPVGEDPSLLDAALGCFSERGVEATGIGALTRATGRSVGSLYHRFGSKEGLAATVYLYALGDYQAAIATELRARPSAEHGVRAVVRRHIDWHEAGAVKARFLHENAGLGRSELAAAALSAINQRFYGDVLGWWRPHVAYGAVRDLDFDLAYVLWLGGAQEYCRLRLGGRTRVKPATAKRVLAEGAWNALRTESS